VKHSLIPTQGRAIHVEGSGPNPFIIGNALIIEKLLDFQDLTHRVRPLN